MTYNPYVRKLRFMNGMNGMAFGRGLDPDDLRERIAEFIGCEPSEIGVDEGTEADGDDEGTEFITIGGVRVARVE